MPLGFVGWEEYRRVGRSWTTLHSTWPIRQSTDEQLFSASPYGCAELAAIWICDSLVVTRPCAYADTIVLTTRP